MSPKRPDGRGLMLPAWDGIIPALNAIRDKNRRNRVGESSADQESQDSARRQSGKSAREMAFLGRLIRRWGEIVGPDLQKHVYPTRLIAKKLHLIAADSQWLHTLRFIKPDLLAKLGRLFPGVGVSEIVSSIGRIPDDAFPKPPRTWPGWETKPPLRLPESPVVDETLRRTIERCAAKLQARQQALEGEGFALCPRCRAIMIPLNVECCSVCVHRERTAYLSGIRSMMNIYPEWGFGDLRREIPEARELEWRMIREELLDEARSRVIELAGEIGRLRAFDPQTEPTIELEELKLEIRRAVLLMIDPPRPALGTIADLEDPRFRGFVPPEWLDVLQQPTGEWETERC